jgi:hypothetical protein
VEREQFIALVLEAGLENEFHFTAAEVASAIVRGHTAWLMSGSPVLQESARAIASRRDRDDFT